MHVSVEFQLRFKINYNESFKMQEELEINERLYLCAYADNLLLSRQPWSWRQQPMFLQTLVFTCESTRRYNPEPSVDSKDRH